MSMRDIYDVTDDLFKVFESIDHMFRHWTSEYHEPFIDEVRKIDSLDKELEEITGDKQKAYLIRVGIYRSIFPHECKYKPTKLK
jgi:hypothetical protein